MHLAINFQRVDPSRGGAETYVADLCRGLVDRGHRVDLYSSSCAEGALAGGVRVVPVAATGPTRWARLLSFARNSEAALREATFDCSIGFINTWHHDVIIPQGGVHPASLEHNARRFPVGWRRSLYTASKRANPKDWLYRSIERRQYDPSRAARVVAVSEFVQEHLQTYYRVPGDRIRVIPNAIDANRLRVEDPVGARLAFRSRLGLGPDDLIALFLAHNFRLKGLDPLLEALRLRLDHAPAARPVHLVVCGGGKIEPYRRKVRSLGLEEHVHLVGFMDDVRPAFAGSDCFVLPSYYDPCSLVVFEALSRGLPVVTTATNGAGEVVTPGREGYVVPEADDLDALADALDQLCDDDRRRAMAGAAERLGKAQSFDAHLDRLVALFEEVAEERRSGSGPAKGSLRKAG
ncbi:glycosyltransferase family 4 protein [Tautonia plasticadhaerens]|uniref:Lipopolysaccharide core biosynthesis protein RfaG n=1 Tax=Tautonia plasticadhaerens TaxID=2527974 RepID=A0A518H557_9BACT|nr:glycosyltransferase family 4 protein [Tautonia plasticadhaerens]QDV35971.1 Lipopolysaccharide core biosynthesis protein RfaG [Tautonia plasticadhaerens]